MILTPKEIDRIRKAYHGQPDVLNRLDRAIAAEDAVNDAWRRYVAIDNLSKAAREMLRRAMHGTYETCPHVVPPGTHKDVGAPVVLACECGPGETKKKARRSKGYAGAPLDQEGSPSFDNAVRAIEDHE